MGLKHDVAKNVRALRIKAGLTQSALAKSSRRDVRYISEIENDPQNMTLDTIESLAKALSVLPSELIRTEQEWGPVPSKRLLPGLDNAIQVLQSYRSLAED